MEQQDIQELFNQLKKQRMNQFPQSGTKLAAPYAQGVYVIRDSEKNVLHVGRTYCGKKGLFQRLMDHLNDRSSFAKKSLPKRGKELRNGYTFQYLEVLDDRKRALLEHFATAYHCPRHLGIGAHSKKPKSKLTK